MTTITTTISRPLQNKSFILDLSGYQRTSYNRILDRNNRFVVTGNINNILFMPQNMFVKDSFVWENKKYNLKNQVVCNIEYQDDLWIIECKRYGLHAFSNNKDEALSQFEEEFAFLCDGLLKEDDNNLTNDAKELKYILKNDLYSTSEL